MAKSNPQGLQRLARIITVVITRSARKLFRRRKALAVVAILAGVGYGSYLLWRQIGPQVEQRSEYLLAAEAIEITPPPSHIRTDVKRQALRDGSLDAPLSLLDEQLAARLAKAFSLHPWVAEVRRVAKTYPAKVTIELVYRQPVAMVEVPGGFFPVDADGILLPSGDFTSLEVRSYPRLSGIKSQPLGAVGTAWGDAAVAGGARIAATLDSVWRDLRLESIRYIQPPPTGADVQPYYALVTKEGTAIPWGQPDDKRLAAEPSSSDKIARLKKYVREHGALDAAARRNDLDLRHPGAMRTATVESEKR